MKIHKNKPRRKTTGFVSGLRPRFGGAFSHFMGTAGALLVAGAPFSSQQAG